MGQDDHSLKRRCCIANDNGQRIEHIKNDNNNAMIDDIKKESKVFIKIKEYYNKFKPEFCKLKNYITEKIKQGAQFAWGDEENTEISKKLKSGVAATIVVCIFVCVTTAFFAPAYDVYLGGKKMGVVSKKEDFDAMLSSANNTIVSIAGEYNKIYSNPVYIFRIIPKLEFTQQDELKFNIISLSNAVSVGYTIVADGNPVVSLKNKSEAEEAINNLKTIYSGNDAYILNNIEIASEFIAENELSDISKAVEDLKPKVSIRTTEVVTYTKEVPFDVQNKQTADLYKGDETVKQEGKAGSSCITAMVTKINGAESASEILSSSEISKPVPKIVMVGTKDKPNGIGSGSFVQPFYGTITSRFGPRWGRTHKGVDIAGEIDSPIKAADNGEVVAAEYKSDYGNIIILDHNNGMQTYYAHLNSIDVKVGDKVEKGQVIGKLGTTGNSTGPHLHFEVRKNGQPCDPGSYLDSMR